MAAPMLQHHLLVVWALAAVRPVLSDLSVVGSYVADLDTYTPCDDIGSLSVIFDVYLVNKGEGTVYEGNITVPYDIDDENLLTQLKIYRWGSTGGWGSFYNVTQYDIMTYMSNNFPKVFKAYFGAMGITGKPAPAGTYHIENFRPMGFKLQNMNFLPYGRYKILIIQSKDGVDLSCSQAVIDVKEDASMKPAGMSKGTPFG